MVRRAYEERTRYARYRTAASEAVSCTTAAVRTESFMSGLLYKSRGCGGFDFRESGFDFGESGFDLREGCAKLFDLS